MLDFVLLMLAPLVIAIAALLFFKGKVTIWEFLGQVGVVALFIAICLGVSYMGRTTDVEVWNGLITEKKGPVPVSCSHSYRCHCHTVTTTSGSGKNRTTSSHEECDTCYEHNHDYDWDVYASTGESLSIDRIDRQGTQMPPRWGAAYIGEPWSSTHSYTNYILANPDSVLLGSKGDVEKYAPLLPEYPAKVYDYYKHDPVINMGVPNVDNNTWNWLVREANKTLGTMKQVNVVVILVPTPNRDYMLALKDKWVGGKKNDVVVVIGSVNGHQIEFADVMSWTPNGSFKVKLKNRIQDIGTMDKRDDIVAAIHGTVASDFQRMHMKDMKYLMRSFQPSQAALIWTFILSTLLSLGLAAWSILNDITDDGTPAPRRSMYSSRYRY